MKKIIISLVVGFILIISGSIMSGVGFFDIANRVDDRIVNGELLPVKDYERTFKPYDNLTAVELDFENIYIDENTKINFIYTDSDSVNVKVKYHSLFDLNVYYNDEDDNKLDIDFRNGVHEIRDVRNFFVYFKNALNNNYNLSHYSINSYISEINITLNQKYKDNIKISD
ncbi:MAG: hypothetical protein WBO70_03745 [Erysipelotrichaceae bacterium]